MRKLRRGVGLVLFGWLTLCSPAVWAEPVESASRITEVVVYLDRALVTRQAECKLSKGAHTVRLAPLPGSIEPGSLSVRGTGEAKVKLFGAQLATKQLEAPQLPRIKELEEEIQQTEDRLRQIQNAREVLRVKREFLESIRAATAEQIGKEWVTRSPEPTDVGAFLGVLDRELTAGFQKAQELEIQWRQTEKQLDRLRREWNQLAGGSARQEMAVLVDLEAESAGHFLLDVSYRLPGATWQPVYEARVGQLDAPVELAAYGLIRQNTGEDWNGVRLTLSTAKPAVGGRRPEVEPWYLRRMEFEVMDRIGKAKEKQKRMAPLSELATGAVLGRDEMEPAELAQAEVKAQGPAVTFVLPRSETIASDGQPRKSPIASYTLPAEFAYEIAPRLSPQAYLRAKAANGTEALLLPGRVEVFLEGGFVGSSSLNLVAPGESFDLFLGVDERIRVQRKALKAKEDVSVIPGLHGRMKAIEFEELTTLESFLPSEAAVVLFDRVPVSQHDEIKVERVAFDPEPTEQDPEKPGVHLWKLTIGPKAKKSFKASYRVRHPLDFVVEGL